VARGKRRRRRRRALARFVDLLLAGLLRFLCRVLPGLPGPWVTGLADLVAAAVFLLDPRGRRVSRQNLRVVFGDDLPRGARRRIVRASYRNALRSVLLLAHLSPLTLARYRRWVSIDPADEAVLVAATAGPVAPVFVSGHLGNWELALAARSVLPLARPLAYLAESTGLRAIDATLDHLRDRGGGGASLRKGGARAMHRAIADGVAVGLLVDRNVRRRHGGRWVPFLGLPARTTPLPASLSRRHGAPLHVVVCLPDGRSRYRLWASPDLRTPSSGDDDADLVADLGRVNDVLSRLVRERPEAWAWMIKRWKDRPTPELGPYPAYSRWDRAPA
jgi:KDO2-lipid IV(A) lauroyltransferase